MLKPKRLNPGDTVAIVSPSWGGPSRFPGIYEMGLRNLSALFDVKIVEHGAREDNDLIYRNPRLRAEFLNQAFADKSVSAIIASIGGDDSVRILPYLDLPTILANPKIFMGFSDTTTMTTYLNTQGLVTFNGPSIMAGFAQLQNLPLAFTQHIGDVLMRPSTTYDYQPYEAWIQKYLEWSAPDTLGQVEPWHENSEGWQWLQGEGVFDGPLFGGCIEVFDFLNGTRFWPAPSHWDGKLMFFETSEDKPPVSQVKYWLRNLGCQGIFDRISGLLFGRARSYSDDEKQELYKVLVQVVAGEFGRPDLPIVANMDFGHTDPQWVMPLGIRAQIDMSARTFRLLEPAVL